MLKKKKKPGELRVGRPAVALAESVPPDVFLDNLTRVIGNYGFQQILLPVVSERKHFSRSDELSRSFGAELIGLEGPAAGELVLPPTQMPAVIRRYLQNLKLQGPHVSKWFHLSPLARLEGSDYETLHELGLYILGEDSPLAGAQLINTVAEIFRELGSAEFVIHINSMGCSTCQKEYLDVLTHHLGKGARELCANCEQDLDKNPMAIFRCTVSACREQTGGAPPIIDLLDEECKANLMGVLESIDELGISYMLNPGFVPQFLREKIVFQIVATERPERTLGFGGNFTSWTRDFGLAEGAPAMGFLTTFEHLANVIPEERRRQGPKVEVFMVPLGHIAVRKAVALHRDLQHSGIAASEAMLSHSSIKHQLKTAVEKKCEIALIIGQKEAIDETVILRDMRSGMQELFALDRIIEEVKKRLGK